LMLSLMGLQKPVIIESFADRGECRQRRKAKAKKSMRSLTNF